MDDVVPASVLPDRNDEKFGRDLFRALLAEALEDQNKQQGEPESEGAQQ